MISLRDEIDIEAPPERVWEWLSHLPENYRAWHPDHVRCQWLRGEPLQVGSVLYMEEYLHGKLHKLRARTTSAIPGQEVHYRLAPGMSGTFRVTPRTHGTRFTAELRFGFRRPMLGALADLLLSRLLGSRLATHKIHMEEEGKNLKQFLESAPGPRTSHDL
ncbi:MAG: hypothetical protein GTN62_11600 [Gemmatimonadales bacterium]|nr:hypothetical protein [Gemmatimonadales bacterium]NIN12276.1 hypothetical protein [Gemmatimonadales bacterium]NIN50739.1 hypothetical protein [Gemmatimonadales bacterium]NIP08203.1 hypothetical protein [Gemmatimonadales bacterium]NIR03481.1 hypothetical protein [Gemmatimonadales bacterium]